MGKITEQIKSTRGSATCSKCNKVIAVGERYLKGIQFGCKPVVRCTKCSFNKYELINNKYLRDITLLKDDWDSVKFELDFYSLSDRLDNIITVLEMMQGELQSSYDNLPDQFRDYHVVAQRLENINNCLDELEEIELDRYIFVDNDDNEDEVESDNDLNKWEVINAIDNALNCL